MRHIKRFFEFSNSDRWTLVSFGLRVPIYKLGLSLLGYHRFQKHFIKLPLTAQPEQFLTYAKHQGLLINMAVSGVAGGENCLLRSVMLTRRLGKLGYRPEIKFGIDRNNSRFQAHSWVEVDGIVLNDRDSVAENHVIFEARNK